jgi:hypothetical protein
MHGHVTVQRVRVAGSRRIRAADCQPARAAGFQRAAAPGASDAVPADKVLMTHVKMPVPVRVVDSSEDVRFVATLLILVLDRYMAAVWARAVTVLRRTRASRVLHNPATPRRAAGSGLCRLRQHQNEINLSRGRQAFSFHLASVSADRQIAGLTDRLSDPSQLHVGALRPAS